jgi:hypothetical protein
VVLPSSEPLQHLHAGVLHTKTQYCSCLTCFKAALLDSLSKKAAYESLQYGLEWVEILALGLEAIRFGSI